MKFRYKKENKMVKNDTVQKQVFVSHFPATVTSSVKHIFFFTNHPL